MTTLCQGSANPIKVEATLPADEILGHSPVLRQLLDELAVLAQIELPVLLLGETGVGKKLFARRLHRQSRRSRRPLVQVNCAALPEALAESELFGHVKGAFSGASHDRAGRFDAANGGTLFLDEVGELPLSVQAKLLRTLQNGEIQRLGADRPLHVDVRIVAATNRDLAERVRDGLFRADLYHRLSVYPVAIPALRERGDDVLVLAEHFVERSRAALGMRELCLSPTARQALQSYAWPGNVRELEHVISRAALKLLCRAGRRAPTSLEPQWLGLGDSTATTQPARYRGSRFSHWPPPWMTVSAIRSAKPLPIAAVTGPVPRGCWGLIPATCTSWRADWGSSNPMRRHATGEC